MSNRGESEVAKLMDAIDKDDTTLAVEMIDAATPNAEFLNECDIYHTTPLRRAASYGKTEVVKALLKHDTIVKNIDAMDIYGQSALFRALFDRHIEVASLLLEHGAQTNVVVRSSLLDIRTYFQTLSIGVDYSKVNSLIDQYSEECTTNNEILA